MYNGMKFDTLTLDNQIEVLAISDERFVKSSAAMAVMAGSMQNPQEHLGLAHFLEHMLFLGTQDYPEVGEYEDFLNKNGGGHNAYTSIDHTNYFFDVVHGGFEGALKRFSRFFVCPTFDEKYVEREKNAVHSEHEKNLLDDGRREYRFQQVITDPAHPFSKFATGDKDTLGQASRDTVMEFYKTHYSANLMRLVLMSNKSSEELSDLANRYFSDVPNLSLIKPVYPEKLFAPGQTPELHHVESIRDQDVLKMSFDVPDDLNYWDSKPTSFLAHLLGEEGTGSLLSYLKNQGLALGLETSTWWRMFHVRVKLTEKGKTQFKDVIKATFSYIELIKKEGLRDYIFNERKVLSQVELQNLEPKSSMGRASHFSASMLYYPVDEFLNRYYLYHKYSQNDFKTFLDCLNPENMQVTLLTQDKFSQKKEPYYGIGYQSEKLSTDFIKELTQLSIYKEFQYPEPNPYLPDDLSLVQQAKASEPLKEAYKNSCILYSQVDTELEIPRGSLSLSFISDFINGDPKKYVLAKLFAMCKKEELNEWGYPARLAGLNYSISHGYNTFTVEVSGLSQHLPYLLSNLLCDTKNNRQINQVQISESRFEKIKVNYKKALENKTFEAAYQQLLYEVSHFFASASVHRKDYLNFVDQLTLKEVNQFAEQFFNKISVRSFVFGNINPESIKPIIDNFYKQIGSQEMAPQEVMGFENKYIQLPSQPHMLVASGPNNNNSQLSFYKFADWSINAQAHIDVLSKIIEQPYFTELRTHQQLGYVVAAFGSSSNGFCGLGTLIQTQNFESTDAFERSNQFINQFLKQSAQKIEIKDVELIKTSIINEISQKPNSMGERLSRFTMMAGTYHGDFNFLKSLSEEVQKVTVDSLQSLIKEQISQGSLLPHICFQYMGADSARPNINTGFTKIDDVVTFKQSANKIQPYRYK